ncbi:3181_t:CDS:2 [Entrophospora sp. SA101]|nr:3181_t:CDS:2 [Entrophospora sp. SA101]
MDESPFMNFGNVERGQVITTLYNNLFRAPLFRHDPKDSDFLVLRTTFKNKSKYYIREIKNIFVVGQTFPMQEVPSPPSRKAKATIAARIQATALRLMKRNRYHIVTHDQLLKRFPDYKEDTIRSRMKEVAELVRKKGTDNNIQIWKLKPSRGVPSEKEIRKILSPEMIF